LRPPSKCPNLCRRASPSPRALLAPRTCHPPPTPPYPTRAGQQLQRPRQHLCLNLQAVRPRAARRHHARPPAAAAGRHDKVRARPRAPATGAAASRPYPTTHPRASHQASSRACALDQTPTPRRPLQARVGGARGHSVHGGGRDAAAHRGALGARRNHHLGCERTPAATAVPSPSRRLGCSAARLPGAANTRSLSTRGRRKRPCRPPDRPQAPWSSAWGARRARAPGPAAGALGLSAARALAARGASPRSPAPVPGCLVYRTQWPSLSHISPGSPLPRPLPPGPPSLRSPSSRDTARWSSTCPSGAAPQPRRRAPGPHSPATSLRPSGLRPRPRTARLAASLPRRPCPPAPARPPPPPPPARRTGVAFGIAMQLSSSPCCKDSLSLAGMKIGTGHYALLLGVNVISTVCCWALGGLALLDNRRGRGLAPLEGDDLDGGGGGPGADAAALVKDVASEA
jgi:hypothetical protein